VTEWTSTVPLPIVLATCRPKIRNATKLKNAAHTTACRGESTRVETTVAIELAASWKPLMKSNASASPMMAMTSQVSGILQDDPLDHVGHVLAAVRRGLQRLDDLHPLDGVHGIARGLEQRGERVALDAVGLALEPVHLEHALADHVGVLHAPQHRHQLADQ